MNAVRQEIVDKAFISIDKNNNGAIEMNEVKMVYNAKLHPKVIEGDRKSTRLNSSHR